MCWFGKMSHVMRKLDICICENKAPDQPCSNHTADQCLCFRCLGCTILLLPKSAISIVCAVWFVFDLVGSPEDQISHDESQI